MQIVLDNLGKRFSRQWIFRKLSYQFETGNSYAIVGPNGSGKSTLLQVIAGAVEKSEGDIYYSASGLEFAAENHYKYLSIATPYLELVEELTLKEFLSFHQSFKPFISLHSVSFIIDYVGLKDAADKQIRYFSSGMKQRVKLAQAVFSHTPVVMLDEPTSNLDTNGIELYQKLINEFCSNRLLVICSNDESEIDFCRYRLNVNDYKTF